MPGLITTSQSETCFNLKIHTFKVNFLTNLGTRRSQDISYADYVVCHELFHRFCLTLFLCVLLSSFVLLFYFVFACVVF